MDGMQDAGTKTCTQCAEEISADAVVCKHCGRKVGAYDRTGAPIRPAWLWPLIAAVVFAVAMTGYYFWDQDRQEQKDRDAVCSLADEAGIQREDC